MNCLVGCATGYACGELKKALDAESLAPWVKIVISSAGGPSITVGNNSYPAGDNTAVIKSFKYGSARAGGAGCDIEIIDEDGTSFVDFVKNINLRLMKGEQDNNVGLTWGWGGAGCGGDPGGLPSVKKPRQFQLRNITTNYEGGRVKYTIQADDMMTPLFQSRVEKIQGNDKQKLPLKEAIRQLFKNSTPSVTTVDFLRLADKGGTTEWSFPVSQGGKQGPISVWENSQQNPLAVAMSWLKDFTTDQNKGIVAAWDDDKQYNGRIIFWEDPQPGWNPTTSGCSRNLGTYVVNGGSCSCVISFSPNIQATFLAFGQGGGIGTGKASAQKVPPPMGSTLKNSGIQTAISPSRQALDTYGPNDMVAKSAQAQMAHATAGLAYKPIEAELRIQGDPTLIGSTFLHGSYVSIIVINPFHLASSCGDWTVKSACNTILSNKMWMIDGVDHDIREGSYITTLKLNLQLPGSNLNPGVPIGGPGSGGITLPNAG